MTATSATRVGRPATLAWGAKTMWTWRRRLFLLPRKSPKLNGLIERSHRTHEEKLYQCFTGSLRLDTLPQALRAWEETCHSGRYQAFGYRTPAEWLAAWRTQPHPTAARAGPIPT